MTYVKGTKTKVSANFNSTEFDCHGSGCCTETITHKTPYYTFKNSLTKIFLQNKNTLRIKGFCHNVCKIENQHPLHFHNTCSILFFLILH